VRDGWDGWRMCVYVCASKVRAEQREKERKRLAEEDWVTEELGVREETEKTNMINICF